MKTLTLPALLFIASLVTPASASDSCDKSAVCPPAKSSTAASGTVQLDLGAAHLSSLPAVLAITAPTPAKSSVVPRTKPARAPKPALPAALFM